MSKESLRQLNESLTKHFKETGINNALYYEPLFDYYWEQNDKIGLCNLESYDKEIQGIQKISAERILETTNIDIQGTTQNGLCMSDSAMSIITDSESSNVNLKMNLPIFLKKL